MQQGLIQIYTGDGKGKTSAAFGQALRAAGQGWKVMIIQFFKNQPSGEVTALQQHFPEIEVLRYHSQQKFVWNLTPTEREQLKQESRKGLDRANRILKEEKCDLLILDEIMYPLHYDFFQLKELRELLLHKPFSTEIILTGRQAAPELVALADLVTEMKKIKHPFDEKIPPRRGIEY